MQARSRMKVDLDFYLKRIEELGWAPNFFTSLAYLEAARAGLVNRAGWLLMMDAGVCMFPPVPMDDVTAAEGDSSQWPDFIWSDFVGWEAPAGYVSEFMDYQFIYDPEAFQNMEGKKWATFRKNSRKWGRRNESPLYVWLLETFERKEVLEFVGNWLEPRGDTFHDASSMLEYIFHDRGGVHLYGVVDKRCRLMAIIGADISSGFVNFRYCITKDEEPYLEEAVRLEFYKTVYPLLGIDKLVNDGGMVDNPDLAWFKERLNPVRRDVIHSWRRGDE